FVTDDQVIRRQIELLECQRKKRKQRTVVFFDLRKAIQKRCGDPVAADRRRKRAWVAKDHEDVCIRKNVRNNFEHSFPDSPPHIPVVNQRSSRGGEPSRLSAVVSSLRNNLHSERARSVLVKKLFVNLKVLLNRLFPRQLLRAKQAFLTQFVL